MSQYTYEKEERTCPLETYEWDNVWWEQADRCDIPRVLYIGDSISCATRKRATQAAGGKLLFDGFGTSKAVDNPYFADSVRMFAKQQGERCAVLFNNGLHGFHLDDRDGYVEHYEKMLKFLLDEFKGTPIIILLTTHVSNPERDKRVVERNKQVSALAVKYGVPTVDLYSVTLENADLISADGVHLLPEGYEILAKTVVEAVESVLKSKKA